jgi:hypothetical protein
VHLLEHAVGEHLEAPVVLDQLGRRERPAVPLEESASSIEQLRNASSSGAAPAAACAACT